MTGQLLIDPALLVPPVSNEAQDWKDFWVRIMDWNVDGRVHLGPATFALATQEVMLCEIAANGENNWLPHTRRERMRAVNSLLSRQIAAKCLKKPLRKFPEYCGPDIAVCALLLDIPATYTDAPDFLGLATSSRHWSEPRTTVKCVPPPPDEIELCFEPNAELKNSLLEKCVQRLDGAKVKIVGGQREDRVISELSGRCSINKSKIEWLQAERNKKPNLKSCTGLRPQDVVICITGRIGHSESIKAKTLTKRANAYWIEVEVAGRIVEELEKAFGF